MSTWFKPKSYGYGVSPANWRGWAATAAYIAATMLVSALLLASQQNQPSAPSALQIAVWALLVAVLTAGFVALARAKTDGQWAWRWGK